MCGIVGQLNRGDGAPVTRELLSRMCAAIVHRGPDDEGLFVDGTFGMGMRRLSINDLAPSGNQPLGNEDGSVQVVCNGEIYNSPELRRDLEARGHRMRVALGRRRDPASLRGARRRFRALPGRHVRAGAVGRAPAPSRRRARLARHQAALRRRAQRHAGLRLRGRWRSSPAGFGDALDFASLHHYLSLGYIPAPGQHLQRRAQVAAGHAAHGRAGEGAGRDALLGAAVRARARRRGASTITPRRCSPRCAPR